MAETSEDSWEEHGAMKRHGFTTVLDLQRIRSRLPGLSQWQGQGQKQGQLGKGKPAYEWGKSNYDGNKASNCGMYKGGERRTVRPLVVSSSGTRRVTASLEGKDLVVASATKR